MEKRSARVCHSAVGDLADASGCMDAEEGIVLDGGSVPQAGCTVVRDRLIHAIAVQEAQQVAVVVCAPIGFGKTALLVQYASLVRSDLTRGCARVQDVERMNARQIVDEIAALASDVRAQAKPLVALDNIPRLSREDAEQVAHDLLAMRKQGIEVVASTVPENRAFLSAMGESCKIGAQALIVRPREYSDWTRRYSIDRGLDMYALTQGIPSLVAMLESVTERPHGRDVLDAAVCNLYRSVIDGFRRARDPLYRIVSLMLYLGKGDASDFEHGGMRLRGETFSRLAHDYPMFGVNVADRSFHCLEGGGAALSRLKVEMAKGNPEFASLAARMLMRAGRVDDAVALCETVLGTPEKVALIAEFPTAFALAGHALFVSRAFGDGSRALASGIEVGMLLAMYMAALTAGEYRMARAAARELRRRASEVKQQVSAADWLCAQAIRCVWGTCSGIDLPNVEFEGSRFKSLAERMLACHVRIYRQLVSEDGCASWAEVRELLSEIRHQNRVDIPLILLEVDRRIDAALHEGTDLEPLVDLDAAVGLLVERRLGALAGRARLGAGIMHLCAGDPLVDERAFVDAGTMAVRESDLPTQLLCLIAEGWQALGTGQAVVARFRGQQVVKLADRTQRFLSGWGKLLEHTAYLLNTSRVGIREDADALDLAQESYDSAEAWSIALHLSAARYDAELSAWFSLHKKILLDARFRPMARLALRLLKDRGSSVRALLPHAQVTCYFDCVQPPHEEETLFDVVAGDDLAETGQIVISLFGGFRVSRNGHVLTDDLWRRRRASVLAARLALNVGSFVSRRKLYEELWPQSEAPRARQNLYVTLSSLRSAMGQHDAGPQYILTQGEGVSLNGEFVLSDVKRFDILARSILLGADSSSASQTIEACLKLEQIYNGPLFIPDCGDPRHFVYMRKLYAAKFVDCILKGIDVALEQKDTASASWLVEAALQQMPMREDLIRRALTVYDASGRRREVVELYNSHLHYMEQELQSLPEPETKELYERIINDTRRAAML